jgi:hypothetical protein
MDPAQKGGGGRGKGQNGPGVVAAPISAELVLAAQVDANWDINPESRLTIKTDSPRLVRAPQRDRLYAAKAAI